MACAYNLNLGEMGLSRTLDSLASLPNRISEFRANQRACLTNKVASA